jgi:SH3-like domain-containing protein
VFEQGLVVPAGGLHAWAEPNPAQPPVARLEAGVDIWVADRLGEWAHVRCSNGWSGWVDGRLLPAAAPPPPPPAAARPYEPPHSPPTPSPVRATAPSAWTATHAVPAGGLDAWESPDGAVAPLTHLAPGVQLSVLETQPNGWTHVVGANGWRGWVDGRRLVGAASGRSGALSPSRRADAPFGMSMPSWWPPEVAVLSAAGAALVLLGSFLPWLTVGPASASAWDISIGFLITGGSVAGGLKVGFILLAVLAVLLPAVTKRALPDAVLPTVGLIAIGAAVLTLIRGLAGITVAGFHVTYDPGFGLFLTLAGGGILAIDRIRAWMAR